MPWTEIVKHKRQLGKKRNQESAMKEQFLLTTILEESVDIFATWKAQSKNKNNYIYMYKILDDFQLNFLNQLEEHYKM